MTRRNSMSTGRCLQCRRVRTYGSSHELSGLRLDYMFLASTRHVAIFHGSSNSTRLVSDATGTRESSTVAGDYRNEQCSLTVSVAPTCTLTMQQRPRSMTKFSRARAPSWRMTYSSKLLCASASSMPQSRVTQLVLSTYYGHIPVLLRSGDCIGYTQNSNGSSRTRAPSWIS
ncbi:hypothetical protein OBBRIDRAFT_358736 [Obba rivulosa]|uniref:Uncharacterized protein n=1 Tax=Obba rivulosa TaxID=1052685 RepID=A0A8E2DU62_9APHY|nr:hypothetical protein OBBRIDRAFT_358736 [Obba rivulosa]